MKKKNRMTSILVIVLAVFLVGLLDVREAETRLVTNVPADISSDALKAMVIEDFESPGDWVVEAVPKKNPDPKKNPVPALELKYIDGSPSDLRAEAWAADKKGMEKKKCLGVHFRFKYPGYNSVHILPPLEVQWDDPGKKVTTYDARTGKEIQERALQLPGRVKGISVWIHGRGNDFYLEGWIKDWRGEVHIVKFGSLNFVGWRPLRAYIPRYVPQSIQSYPQTKIMKLMRFVIRATPEATTEDVYVFLDQFKVLTDTFEVNFDGQELHKAFQKGGQPKASVK